jgi:peroxiredoxin
MYREQVRPENSRIGRMGVRINGVAEPITRSDHKLRDLQQPGSQLAGKHNGLAMAKAIDILAPADGNPALSRTFSVKTQSQGFAEIVRPVTMIEWQIAAEVSPHAGFVRMTVRTVSLGVSSMVKTASTMLPIGTTAPDFSLPNVDGTMVSRGQLAGKPLLLIFMCNHCPFVIHLRDALAAFADEYQARGLAVVGINSNDVEHYPQDGPDEMKSEAVSAGYQFPYLFDLTQDVARAYRAACTPDFFLFDADHSLVYRGQFDSSRPGNDVAVTGEDLRAACDAVLSGRDVSSDQAASIGCNIKWAPGKEPEYFTGQAAV